MTDFIRYCIARLAKAKARCAVDGIDGRENGRLLAWTGQQGRIAL
jgi:hypothetical protein